MNQKLDAAVRNLVDALNTDADILDRLTRIEKKLDELLRRVTPTDEMLTAEQVGELLGYSRRTIADRHSKQPGFPKRYGKRWRKSEVLAWAAKRR